MHCNPDFPADILPVDVCMNAIITAAWERGLAQDRKDVDFRNIVGFDFSVWIWSISHFSTLITNCQLCIHCRHWRMISNWHGARPSIRVVTFSTKIHCVFRCGIQTVQLNRVIGIICSASYFSTICQPISLMACWCWCAENHCKNRCISITTFSFSFSLASGSNWNYFSVYVFIFSLVGIQRRISQGLKVLQYYTTKNWTFKNDKFLSMKNKLTAKDKELFYFSIEEVM